MTNTDCPISLSVATDPHLARLVRMTAANVAMLSSMSVDRVEDIRMAAEEAFIYACSSSDAPSTVISFAVDHDHVAMTFELPCDDFSDDSQESVYADLILASVCDSYEKETAPARLHLELKADV